MHSSAHMRTCWCTPPLMHVKHIASGSLTTHQVWAQCVQPYLNGKVVLIGARADVPMVSEKVSSPEAPRQPGADPRLPSSALVSGPYYCYGWGQDGSPGWMGQCGKAEVSWSFFFCIANLRMHFSTKINQQNLTKISLTLPKSTQSDISKP